MAAIVRVQRNATRAALPGVRFTAAKTERSTGVGTELAKANADEQLAGFGGVVAQTATGILDVERQKANQVQILSVERRMAEWENNYLYNPTDGAFTVQGKDAMGLPEKTQEEFARLTGMLEKELTNPQQRAMFERAKLSRQMGLDLNMQRYVSGEMKKYEAGEMTAAITAFGNSAVANAGDPMKVRQELDRATGALEEHGHNVGMTPKQIEVKKLEIQSQVHEGVISRLLTNEQDQQAEVYFQEAKKAGQLSGPALEKIEGAIAEGTTRGESQRQTEAIIAAHPDDFAAQRTAAKEIKNSKVQDQVLQRLDHEETVRDKIQRDKAEKRSKDAYGILDRTKDVTKIPPDMWNEFTGGERASMMAYAEHKAAGIPIKTNSTRLYSLMQMAGDKPEEFVKENLMKYRAELSDGDFEQFARMQLGIKEGARNAQANAALKPLDDFNTRSQILESSLELYGINPNPKPGTKEADQVAQLRRLLDTAVEAQVAGVPGKKISNADIQEHVDALMIEHVTQKGSFWNAMRYGFAAFNDQVKRPVDMTIADVPAAKKQEISQKLRARQRAVTPQTILDAFILETIANERQKK